MKLIIYTSIFVFGALGSYLPVWLFGEGVLDISSLLGGLTGSIAGVFFGYKLGQYFDI